MSTGPSTRSTRRHCSAGVGTRSSRSATSTAHGSRSTRPRSRTRPAELEFELACTLVVQALVEDDPFEAEADRDAARIIFDVLGATPTWLPLDPGAGPADGSS